MSPGITEIVTAIQKMDTWLKSMRQEGGYAGPVAHWWQHCMLYTGPGIDWRYEGLLAGYHLLYQQSGHKVWKARLVEAVSDVLSAQCEDGSYRSSQFEMNPGTLGTPHEAAATLGLLTAFPSVQDEAILVAAKRNLNHLIAQLWDEQGKGFNDRPGIAGRVPNKLATLAETLMEMYNLSNDEKYLSYAKCALDSVLPYQTPYGAIHQYGAEAGTGDSKFFPFYNARCVPSLVKAWATFGDNRYSEAAERIVLFLESTMDSDGSWDQIVYPKGRAFCPRWIAGSADILRAFRFTGKKVPDIALRRLLDSQLESGGFPTAQGFSNRFRKTVRSDLPTFQDILPVVGWNDKTFRFLIEHIGPSQISPRTDFAETRRKIRDGVFYETVDFIQVFSPNGAMRFLWEKANPWSRCELGVLA